MTQRLRFILAAFFAAFGFGDAGVADELPRFAAADIAFFESDVLPLLKTHCFKCHGGEAKVRGGLRLTSRDAVLKGGDLGPAVPLAKPDESRLLQAINYKDGLEMPPRGKLPQKEIDILTRWVMAGLPWTPGAGAKERGRDPHAVVNARDDWSYQPVRRPDVPAVKDRAWVRSPVDAFLLAKLEAKGLAPDPPADRVALLRRVTYDLTGLPPLPEAVDAFVHDKSPDAYEKVIDRLLASPQYGEKWGRHWLDLVRYAETNGYERDGPKPFAWRYRDYVIGSFNTDKPFDRFLREQLAGDELDRDDRDCVIATGYYRLGLWDDEPVDMMQARYDELDDIVATTAQVVLGMTMNCARCHDHKIDPIPQADYYRLVAFFQDIPHFSDTRETSSRNNLTDITSKAKRALYEAELKQRQERLDELTRQIIVLENEAIQKMPVEDQRASEGLDRPQVLKKVPGYLEGNRLSEYNRLRGVISKLNRQPTPSQEMALSVNRCSVYPPITHVLIRGNPHAPAAKVEPGYPTALGGGTPALPTPGKDARSSGRRTVLANWLTAPANPRTARVFVNRLWQHHFGRGLVASANDFGKFGTPPSHPELLDWLADNFVTHGWHIKRMHKLLLLSTAYQMSSAPSEKGLRLDPANALWWRYPMRRLAAEEVRDSILAVSGRLNLKAGGPSIYPPIPKEVLAGQSRPGEGWGKSPPEEASRRSVYGYVKRSLLVPVLAMHDQADTDSSCPVRYTTTVPTQALGLLNGEFTNDQAAALAERLRKEAPDDVPKQVRRAIRLTTGRVPDAEEVRRDAAFVGGTTLRQYCLLLLNANEFLYLD